MRTTQGSLFHFSMNDLTFALSPPRLFKTKETMSSVNYKYKLGQNVWFMRENKPEVGPVYSVNIYFDIDGNRSTSYSLVVNGGQVVRKEPEISDTKEGLRDIIFGK